MHRSFSSTGPSQAPTHEPSLLASGQQMLVTVNGYGLVPWTEAVRLVAYAESTCDGTTNLATNTTQVTPVVISAATQHTQSLAAIAPTQPGQYKLCYLYGGAWTPLPVSGGNPTPLYVYGLLHFAHALCAPPFSSASGREAPALSTKRVQYQCLPVHMWTAGEVGGLFDWGGGFRTTLTLTLDPTCVTRGDRGIGPHACSSVVDDEDNTRRSGALRHHAHGSVASHVVDNLSAQDGQQKTVKRPPQQPGQPSVPITGLC